MTDNENCPCKRIKCKRYGNCEACRAYHSASKSKPLPVCEREKPLEGAERRERGCNR